MIRKKMLNIFLILILMNFLDSTDIIENGSTCLMQTKNYQSEYLHATKDFDYFLNGFRLKPSDFHLYSRFTKRVVASKEVKLKEKIPFQNASFSWQFHSVKDQKNTFFIRSLHYSNEYLCSTNSHLDLFNSRRKVNLIRINKMRMKENSNKKCMWRLDADQVKNAYFIWNVYYKEPLYIASSLYQEKRGTRSALTWHKKPNSLQFEWTFSCFTNKSQIFKIGYTVLLYEDLVLT